MPDETPKKHPCPDCIYCQWCADDRCKVCLSQSAMCCRRKRSIAEQIAAYDTINSSEAGTQKK
ncbi:MAG: hypothetical protein PHY09_04690 [Desulfuromonadaceae bacterium]|nr:hypothetical protein [Desulfuromonadaceae bacterium]MDD5104657.1 hypothetical protein [Desulfuromonadaceae bacterium]